MDEQHEQLTNGVAPRDLSIEEVRKLDSMLPNAPPPKTIALDEVTSGMLADLQSQLRQVLVAQQTVLEVFKRQHGLRSDEWALTENNRELIRKEV